MEGAYATKPHQSVRPLTIGLNAISKAKTLTGRRPTTLGVLLRRLSSGSNPLSGRVSQLNIKSTFRNLALLVFAIGTHVSMECWPCQIGKLASLYIRLTPISLLHTCGALRMNSVRRFRIGGLFALTKKQGSSSLDFLPEETIEKDYRAFESAVHIYRRELR